jgi:F0F1-type ATP synthase membrane subunit a
VTINWNGKRRWIAGLLLLAGILVMINIPPVIPVISLPGEPWPGGVITNSLAGSVVVWILLVLLMIYVQRKRPKTGNEVPPGGFYNIFEMLVEGLYGFVGGVAGGPYLGRIFKMFMNSSRWWTA